MIRLEAQTKAMRQEKVEMVAELERMQADVRRTREAKEKAEGNVEEIKERMRLLLREQQEERA